ncbi:MAG: hypothetical protein OEV06_11795 [Anaerolineae bacterium]|nr:hypothetical protein [Anaerolineae bacterium]
MYQEISDLLFSHIIPSRLLEAEHALVMLLLLYALLIYRGDRLERWAPLVVVGGVLLSIFTPIHEIDLFWPVITGLSVPPLLWQAAVAVTKSGPLRQGRSLAVWGITLLLVTASLYAFSDLPFSNALLVGTLTITLVWTIRERKVERTYLSTLGQITLVVLLVEIDIEVVSLNTLVGTVISGLAIGFGMGFAGIYVFRRVVREQGKNAFFFLWAYLSYMAGLLFETSAIAATLAAALVTAVYGYSTGVWRRQEEIPTPANIPFFFYLAGAIWMLLGWQAHIEVETAHLWGIPVALAVIAVSILMARRVSPLNLDNRWPRLLRKELRALLLLTGAILLWPSQADLTTLEVEIALVSAAVLILLMRETIKPVFELLGRRVDWPSDPEE